MSTNLSYLVVSNDKENIGNKSFQIHWLPSGKHVRIWQKILVRGDENKLFLHTFVHRSNNVGLK